MSKGCFTQNSDHKLYKIGLLKKTLSKDLKVGFFVLKDAHISSMCSSVDKGVRRGQPQQVGVGVSRGHGPRGVSHVGPDGSLQRPGELGSAGAPPHPGPRYDSALRSTLSLITCCRAAHKMSSCVLREMSGGPRGHAGGSGDVVPQRRHEVCFLQKLRQVRVLQETDGT